MDRKINYRQRKARIEDRQKSPVAVDIKRATRKNKYIMTLKQMNPIEKAYNKSRTLWLYADLFESHCKSVCKRDN